MKMLERLDISSLLSHEKKTFLIICKLYMHLYYFSSRQCIIAFVSCALTSVNFLRRTRAITIVVDKKF